MFGVIPSSIYSCSISHIWEHEFCHLGFWAIKGKFLKRQNFCLKCYFLGSLLHVFMGKNSYEFCSAVCHLYSFFIVYPHFFVVYSCGKQWGNMQKSYNMQQRSYVSGFSYFIKLIVVFKTFIPEFVIFNAPLSSTKLLKKVQIVNSSHGH